MMQRISVKDYPVVVHESSAEAAEEKIMQRLKEFEQYEIVSADTKVVETSKTVHRLNFVTTLIVRGIKFGDEDIREINTSALLDKVYRSTLTKDEREQGLKMFIDYYRLTGDLANTARLIIVDEQKVSSMIESQRLELIKKAMRDKTSIKEIGSNNNTK